MKKLSYEYIKTYIEKDNNFELISNEYTNNSTKIKLKCSCGNIFETSFNQFKKQKNKYCKKCNIKKRTLEQSHSIQHVKSTIEEKFSNIVNVKYTLIDNEYKNILTKLNIEDSNCYKYYSNFKNITKNIRDCCPLIKFSIRNKYTIYNINNWIKINKISINLLSEEYNGNNKYLTWKCQNGHKFKRTWNEVYSGCRCPKCKSSQSEQHTREILILNNVNYKEQYMFDDLVSPNSNRRLRFDFCIFYNNEKILLELDGQFHYKENPMIKDKNKRLDALKTQKFYDKLKNKYCFRNKLKLIRIPYWEFDNIKDILIKNKII